MICWCTHCMPYRSKIIIVRSEIRLHSTRDIHTYIKMCRFVDIYKTTTRLMQKPVYFVIGEEGDSCLFCTSCGDIIPNCWRSDRDFRARAYWSDRWYTDLLCAKCAKCKAKTTPTDVIRIMPFDGMLEKNPCCAETEQREDRASMGTGLHLPNLSKPHMHISGNHTHTQMQGTQLDHAGPAEPIDRCRRDTIRRDNMAVVRGIFSTQLQNARARTDGNISDAVGNL
jgi:hypothetical protein